jgi:cytochrome c oxidase assembly protein subunit 11
VPAQRDVRVVPGESALAFYVTKNNSDKAITGVATYNVAPPQAGPYFVKIQCFCFDEQRLQAGEEVDMPVLFVIDPKFLDDPSLKRVSNITLSYNFFRTDDDEEEDE